MSNEMGQSCQKLFLDRRIRALDSQQVASRNITSQTNRIASVPILYSITRSQLLQFLMLHDFSGIENEVPIPAVMDKIQERIMKTFMLGSPIEGLKKKANLRMSDFRNNRNNAVLNTPK